MNVTSFLFTSPSRRPVGTAAVGTSGSTVVTSSVSVGTDSRPLGSRATTWYSYARPTSGVVSTNVVVVTSPSASAAAAPAAFRYTRYPAESAVPVQLSETFTDEPSMLRSSSTRALGASSNGVISMPFSRLEVPVITRLSCPSVTSTGWLTFSDTDPAPAFEAPKSLPSSCTLERLVPIQSPLYVFTA